MLFVLKLESEKALCEIFFKLLGRITTVRGTPSKLLNSMFSKDSGNDTSRRFEHSLNAEYSICFTPFPKDIFLKFVQESQQKLLIFVIAFGKAMLSNPLL